MNEEEIIEKVMQHVKYIENAIAEPGSPAEALFGLWELYNQEKEKNKKLEEEYAKAIESEADIAVGSHKLINNLAQAIRFMGTNENLTVEDIIKDFSKENEVTEEFMERWEESQFEESHLKDKVIDLMIKGFIELKDDDEMYCTVPDDFCNPDECIKVADCADCIKEYYFKKARGDKSG